MRPRLISFDLDHTLWNPDQALIDAEQASFNRACELSQAFAGHYSSEQFFALRQALYRTLPNDLHRVSWLRQQAFEKAFIEVGHTEKEAQELAVNAFEAFYRIRQQVVLDPYTETLLTELNRDYTLGAISNGNACVKLVGLGEYFAFHFKGEDFPRAKPWPEMFVAAQKFCSISLTQTVHIGDHPRDDVWAARAVGATPIWFNPQFQPWPLAYGAPPVMAHALREIPELLEKLSL